MAIKRAEIIWTDKTGYTKGQGLQKDHRLTFGKSNIKNHIDIGKTLKNLFPIDPTGCTQSLNVVQIGKLFAFPVVYTLSNKSDPEAASKLEALFFLQISLSGTSAFRPVAARFKDTGSLTAGGVL